MRTVAQLDDSGLSEYDLPAYATYPFLAGIAPPILNPGASLYRGFPDVDASISRGYLGSESLPSGALPVGASAAAPTRATAASARIEERLNMGISPEGLDHPIRQLVERPR